jgi:hypothetical protein
MNTITTRDGTQIYFTAPAGRRAGPSEDPG